MCTLLAENRAHNVDWRYLLKLIDRGQSQKVSLRVILKNAYNHYENALTSTSLSSLKNRRQQLCLKFAKSCLKDPYAKTMFPLNSSMTNSRKKETYDVQIATTSRLQKSSIPYMQNLLNND